MPIVEALKLPYTIFGAPLLNYCIIYPKTLFYILRPPYKQTMCTVVRFGTYGYLKEYGSRVQTIRWVRTSGLRLVVSIIGLALS